MNVPCKAIFITTSCAVLFLCNRNFLVHNKKIHKNRRKYVRLESYFLLKHAIQWTAPPEYSSVSFQSYLLYFCTAAQFLCFCNGLFLLYSNERFFAFRTSYVLFMLLYFRYFFFGVSAYVFGGLYLSFIRFPTTAGLLFPAFPVLDASI